MWPALADARPVATHTRSPSRAGCTTRTLGCDPLAVARYAHVALAAVAWTLSQNCELLIKIPHAFRNIVVTNLTLRTIPNYAKSTDGEAMERQARRAQVLR